MNRRSLKLQVSSSIGTVSAEYIAPEASKCIMTLSHGAGAGMNHSFMVTPPCILPENHKGLDRGNNKKMNEIKKESFTPAL
jgi:hypothetical protein